MGIPSTLNRVVIPAQYFVISNAGWWCKIGVLSNANICLINSHLIRKQTLACANYQYYRCAIVFFSSPCLSESKCERKTNISAFAIVSVSLISFARRRMPLASRRVLCYYESTRRRDIRTRRRRCQLTIWNVLRIKRLHLIECALCVTLTLYNGVDIISAKWHIITLEINEIWSRSNHMIYAIGTAYFMHQTVITSWSCHRFTNCFFTIR